MTRSIDELVADLSSPDGVVRDQALGMLVSYGTRATAALLPLLDSDDRELRARAARALGHIAD
ncbi:MAG TPA: HEAT repeat domain-containing protein, partial [Kofleriaceae bacterium]|nr:HEAT repeat domain-containing protein [Kofleriaceae bacterium]